VKLVQEYLVQTWWEADVVYSEVWRFSWKHYRKPQTPTANTAIRKYEAAMQTSTERNQFSYRFKQILSRSKVLRQKSHCH